MRSGHGFGRNRRLAKDFENLAEYPDTFVTLASIQLTLTARKGVRPDDGGLQSMVKRPSPGRPATNGTRGSRTIDGTRMSMGIRLPPSVRRIDRALGNFSIDQDQPP